MPCSACYTVLLKTNRYLRESPELRDKVDALLAKAGLRYDLDVRVRHPLDVLVNDVGIERIVERRRPAARRGCASRPITAARSSGPNAASIISSFPRPWDSLFRALGAEPAPLPGEDALLRRDAHDDFPSSRSRAGRSCSPARRKMAPPAF